MLLLLNDGTVVLLEDIVPRVVHASASTAESCSSGSSGSRQRSKSRLDGQFALALALNLNLGKPPRPEANQHDRKRCQHGRVHRAAEMGLRDHIPENSTVIVGATN